MEMLEVHAVENNRRMPLMKDMEKRKRVMARSMRLGHCICDSKKSCPCDIFQEQDVCPCAGERLDGRPNRTGAIDEPGRERGLRFQDR